MKRSIPLLVLAATLASCSSLPPVSGTVVTGRGEVTVHPDGRVEVVIEPRAEK